MVEKKPANSNVGDPEAVKPVTGYKQSVVHDPDRQASPSFFDRVRRNARRVKYAGQVAIVGAVVLPVNEAIRIPPAAAVQAYTHNSVAGGVALGLTTFAVESLGVWSTADLIDTHYGGRVFEWLNEKKEKVLNGRKMSPAVEALTGYFGGSAVVLAAKQSEDPTRTVAENRRHGLLTSTWLSALVGSQWMTGGNVIQDPNLLNAGLVFATTFGAYGGAKYAQSREKKTTQ